MKKLGFALILGMLIAITLCCTVFGAEIISAECNKHGVMIVQGLNIPDEVFNIKFIATGDTKEIMIDAGYGYSVIAKNPYGNLGKNETVGMETGNIGSGTLGTRVFKFKAVGYDGTETPYDKEIILECYGFDGKGKTILSFETDKTVIKELVAGHDEIEKLNFTIATTIETRDLIAINEKGDVIKDIVAICADRGYCDIIDGVKYWHFYFISPIVGERSFTFYASDEYYNKRGQAFTVNYTTLSDLEWYSQNEQGASGGAGDQPGTDEGFSSGDDKNATGNEDGVENGGKGQSDTDTNEGSLEKGENSENSKPDGEVAEKPTEDEKPKDEEKTEQEKPAENNNSGSGNNGYGNCCKPEDFISFIVPATTKAIVIEFPDGRKFSVADQEKKNLAKREESQDGQRVFFDVWIGSEFEYDDLEVTVYGENYEKRLDYSVFKTNPFTEEDIKRYESAIQNEIRIEVAPNKKIIELKIGSKFMTVDGEQLEVDPGRETAPLIVDGRTMLPIRAIVEALGGTISWEESKREVGVKIFNKDIKFYIDSLDMTWNGIPDKTDVPPQIINERTMLPIRFVTEVLDHTEITWNGEKQTVTIIYNY